MMDTNELIGLTASFLAALAFGTYAVPMKGEDGKRILCPYIIICNFASLYFNIILHFAKATRVDVDPLVFQTYKAFTVFVSYILYDDIYSQLIIDHFHRS